MNEQCTVICYEILNAQLLIAHISLCSGKENMLFTEYLKSQRLTANVQHYIRQAIAMATDTTTTLEVCIGYSPVNSSMPVK